MNIILLDQEFIKSDIAIKFNQVLKDKLENYVDDIKIINKMKKDKIVTELNECDIIVIYNDFTDENILDLIIEKQKIKGFTIWPVALNKENRMPTSEISEIQSFDVYNLLAKRNLDDSYIDIAVDYLARKIITKMQPYAHNEKAHIFLSHRRTDGESIASKISDLLNKNTKLSCFRDIDEVTVGENAQEVIDAEMIKSDVFVFLDTKDTKISKWIKKELMFAIIRNIPIIWVSIDGAKYDDLNISKEYKPSFSISSKEFKNEGKLIEITDQITNKIFELMHIKSSEMYDLIEYLKQTEYFDMEEMCSFNKRYMITANRKGYKYKQRKLKHVVQIFSRNITDEDLEVCSNTEEIDCQIFLTNKVLKMEEKDGVIIENFDDFIFEYQTKYGKLNTGVNNDEIVIIGAFPNCAEEYKQAITDGINIFAKEILKNEYKLTFGSHPTFQELFFGICEYMKGDKSKNYLNMYISKYFEDLYANDLEKFKENANLYEIEKCSSQKDSLTKMRKSMIERKNVKAVVSFGGMIKTDKSEEGIREEIDVAIKAGIPVYIIGSTGGSSSEIAREYAKNEYKGLNNSSKKINENFTTNLNFKKLASDFIQEINKSEID